VQAPLAGGGEPVGAPALAVHDGPVPGDQAGRLQAVQRRVDGAGGQVEPAAAALRVGRVTAWDASTRSALGEGYDRGPYMMTATPIKQMTALMRS
jgi:hypothetical protein